jgi:hypothetical protein
MANAGKGEDSRTSVSAGEVDGRPMAVPEMAFSFGPFRLLPRQNLLLQDGNPIPLGSRAFEILVALVERAGEVLNRNTPRLDRRGMRGVREALGARQDATPRLCAHRLHRAAQDRSRGQARAHRKGGMIRVVQSKTGEELCIPEHKELSAELGRGVVPHISLLTTTQGEAFDEVYFGAWFADAIEDADLPDDCVLHGLQKTAARRLADADCTESQIMAITGHTTPRMVAKYTKAANQKKQASAAILKLERNRQ